MTVTTTKHTDNLGCLIGKTPLLEVIFKYKGEKCVIYAKLETANLTGSIKDRMAHHIIKESYKNGTLKPGDEIVEATSGNTGIAFSAIGTAMNHKALIFMPDWMSEERIKLIKSFGAKIHLVSKEEGGFLGSIAKAEEYAKSKEHVFLPRQFENNFNCEAHYKTTGPEIITQLEKQNLIADAFIAGVGTGGTIMGVSRCLKESNPKVKLFPLEPANSPTISTGYKVGKHRIQGISDEFVPAIVNLEELDEVIAVDDGDAIIMAQELTKKMGLGVGISSGANFLGAVKAMQYLEENPTIVTVFCDCNKKYLSTDLQGIEPIKPGFISTDIELLTFNIIN